MTHDEIEEEQRRRVYLAFTPYHLLLSLALQDRDGYPDATILFADEARLLSYAPQIRAAVQDLVDLRSGPTLEGHPRWQYPLRCRAAAASAQRFIRQLPGPIQVYVANGVRPEAQRIFRKPRARMAFSFVEDGLDSYISTNREDITIWRRAVHRLLCGSNHPSTGDMIRARDYGTYHTVMPKFSRAPHAASEIIPAHNVMRAIGVLQPTLGLPPCDRAITDLYLLANSERLADPAAYIGALRARLRQGVSDDPARCIAIKAHPREKNHTAMETLRDVSDYIVPHWVPAELLVGLLSPQVSIYCGLTTFVLTSHLLLPGRRLHLDQTVLPVHAQTLRSWDTSLDSEVCIADRPNSWEEMSGHS